MRGCGSGGVRLGGCALMCGVCVEGGWMGVLDGVWGMCGVCGW